MRPSLAAGEAAGVVDHLSQDDIKAISESRWAVPKCSAHGLRKAGARLLAEAGASEYEVMSYLGDRSPKVASRYVAAASRAKMGATGMAKLGTERARELTNLFGRLVNSEV